MATPPPLNKQKENEKLNIFLVEMDDLQDAFLTRAAAEGYRLDYALNSLSDVERYVRDKQLNWRDKSDEAVDARGDVWSYLGETFRRAYGGRWGVSIDDLNNVNYGQYVIEDFGSNGVEFPPLSILQGYLLRGKPGSLRKMLDVHVRFVPTDLGHIPEETE